jgi:hypothetical protein
MHHVKSERSQRWSFIVIVIRAMLDTTEDINEHDMPFPPTLLYIAPKRAQAIASPRVIIAIATLQSRNAALPFPPSW